MRICRFNGDRLGVVVGESICDVTGALNVIPALRWPLPPGDALFLNLHEVRKAIMQLMPVAAKHRIESVTLNAPVPNPSKIVAAVANYALHTEESKKDPGINMGVHSLDHTGFNTPSDKYGLFLKATSSLAGPADSVQLHFANSRNDHEAEVVVVIGTQCKNVVGPDAWKVIAGYTLGVDVTARGGQDRSYRKSADTYAVLGPWVTTADEVDNPENIDFSLSVNGVQRQSSSTHAMTVKIPRLIELASAVYTLYPGDLIYTGTPEGVGPLAAGDVIELKSPILGNMRVSVAPTAR